MADEKMERIEQVASEVVGLVMPLVAEFDGRAATLCLEKATATVKRFCNASGLPPA
jgi:hypothetical protein